MGEEVGTKERRERADRAGGPGGVRLGTVLWRLSGSGGGVLPVIGGLVLLSILFQLLSPVFLTAGNLVNLLVQGSVYILLALGMTPILVIKEIDLSVGFVAGVSAAVTAVTLFGNDGWPWWAACGAGLATATGIGLLQGSIVTFLSVPSFVVTLGGQLAWAGVMLLILGEGTGVPVTDPIVGGLANGLIAPTFAWILWAVVIGLYGVFEARSHRRASEIVGQVTGLGRRVLRIALVAAAGAGLVAICNIDRGRLNEVRGVPWVIILVLGFTLVLSTLLSRTVFGNHVYAIGGNAEAARRAGIPVNTVRIAVFCIGGFMAGIASLVYASRLRSISSNIDGGTLVLYAIAACVIGGTSLFGGRGRAVNAVLGGLVIAAVDNGMGLLGVSAAMRMIATGSILVVAVVVDAFVRRGRAAAGLSG